MISGLRGSIRKISGNFNQNAIVNINDNENELYVICGISNGGANDSISTNIYEVWLEK